MRDTKKDILSFWFMEIEERQWFQVNPSFDALVRDRFEDSYLLAAKGFYNGWQFESDGALALIIMLDQFPRNMYRGTSRAFESDHLALSVARHAVAEKLDQLRSPRETVFMYLPYEHSENQRAQQTSLDLFTTLREEQPMAYDYAVRHKEVIDRFGRFPHRNAALNRKSTEEEIAFLQKTPNGF